MQSSSGLHTQIPTCGQKRYITVIMNTTPRTCKKLSPSLTNFLKIITSEWVAYWPVEQIKIILDWIADTIHVWNRHLFVLVKNQWIYHPYVFIPSEASLCVALTQTSATENGYPPCRFRTPIIQTWVSVWIEFLDSQNYCDQKILGKSSNKAWWDFSSCKPNIHKRTYSPKP